MRTKPRSAKALLCFLAFFLFDLASSVDSPAIPKKSEVQKTQDEIDFVSKQYWMDNNVDDDDDPEEYIENASIPAPGQDEFEETKAFDTKLCELTPDTLQQLKSLNDSDWVINDETLKLLGNDPQRMLDCTQSGDRVLFAVTGKNQFKQTMVVNHELEFISKTPKTEKSLVDNWTDTVSYTCPDFGPFLIVNSAFEAAGFIIDSCSLSSGNGVVVISPGASAIFKNVNISDNKNIAFFVEDDTHLTLNNSYFKDNHIENYFLSGGVIFAGSRGHLTLFNCIFLENSAFSGGAIYANGNENNIMIANCTLHGNAANSGGAIYSTNGNAIKIEASTLSGNSAWWTGGAIYYNANNTVFIEMSAFIGNSASMDGGAIYYNANNTVVIEMSSFIGNNATCGGALYFSKNNNVKTYNSTLNGNNASKNGGTVYYSDNNIAIVENSTLNANSVRDTGGAIFSNDNNVITILHSTIIGNIANYGGAIYTYDSNIITIVASTLTDNHASSLSGALHLYTHNNLTILRSSLNGNNASHNGGAIYSTNSNKITILHSSLSGNKASREGGAISVFSNTDVVVRHCTLNGNKASTKGGAIYAYMDNVIKIENSTLKKNTASIDGGALDIRYRNEVIILSSKLIRNIGFQSGGALNAERDDTIAIYNSSFSNNIAQFGGVMLVARGSTVNISTCKFEGNNATEGGAIVANIGSIVSICNSSFLSNMADFGGCLYGRSSTTNIQSSTFDKNWSSQSGGCFYFESSIANFKSIGLSLNNAIKEGGGICLTFTSLLTIENSHVDSNMAFNGGGIAALSDSRLLCGRTTIFNNTAAQGGGLYFESNMKHIIIAELQTSSVKNNKALRFGGGMVVKSFGGRSVDCANTHNKCSRVLVVNTDFKSNTAATTGAAILATKLDNILLDCYTDSIWLDYFDFYSRQQLQKSIDDGHFYELDPKELCYSWKGNWLPHDAHGGIIGTFGLTLSVTTINTNGTRINEGSTSRLTLKNVKSGTPLPSIKMVAIDAFGNIYAPTLHEKDALMLSSMDDFLQQPISSSFTNGTCIVRGIISYILPGNYTIQVHSREDDILEEVNITISVRECVINEEPTSDKKFCEKCGIASYNFNITKVNGCTQCPKGASCNGSFIVPMEGYWHKGPCHDRVKNCIADKACKDANRAEAIANVTRSLDDCRISDETLDKYDEAQCHKGYKGPLCGSCNSTYGFSSNFECLKCARTIVVILRFLGAIAYLLIGAIITIKGVITSRLDQQTQQDERLLLEPSSSTHVEGQVSNQTMEEIENGGLNSQQAISEENVEQSNSNAQQDDDIEITLNFFQVTSTAASMDVEWTSKILGMLEGLNILGAATTTSVSYSIDCLISSASNATKAVWRLLFSLFVPNIAILLLALHWGYRCFTKHEGNRLYFSKRLLLTVVTVVYITYFDLTQVSIRVFSCVGVHDNESQTSNAITRYWIGDTSIECYENTHIILMGIALVILVLVSICFPIACSISLSQKSEEIEDKLSWTYETLGFLGGPFKKTYVYWECITMIKKALLSIIIVFSYSLGNQIQGLLILIVLVLFLYFHTLCYPYSEEYHTLNYYESGSLLVSCVTYTLVQFFNVERCSEVTRGIISLILIAINGGFVCIMAFKIIREATNLVRAFLRSKNIHISKKANIVTLLRVYSKVKRSRFSSA